MPNVFEILSDKDYNFTNSRELSTMSEPMDLEEDMLRPPSPGMKEYEAEFPALSAGPDNKVSEVDLNFSLLDTNDEDRIVSHDGKVFSLDKGGLTFMSKNEISPPVKKPSSKPIVNQALNTAHIEGFNELNEINHAIIGENAGMTVIPGNVLPVNKNHQSKHSAPYLSIRDSLMKVPYIRKTVIHNLPKVCLPLYPVDYPMSAIVTCNDGKKAIINRVPVRNIKEPPFYSCSVKDLGAKVNLEHFVCKTGYTITFYTQRKCRTCPSEQDIFPKNNVGTLILGDAYTPPMVGGKGRCIPVFRMEHPAKDWNDRICQCPSCASRFSGICGGFIIPWYSNQISKQQRIFIRISLQRVLL